MPDQIPPPHALVGILASALAYIDADHHANERPSGRTFQTRAVALARLREQYRREHAAAPHGYPEATAALLREIGDMGGGNTLAPPGPDQFPGLRERIESLLNTAVEILSGRNAGETPADLIRDGFQPTTAQELHDKALALYGKKVAMGGLQDMAKRAITRGVILDYRICERKLWVKWAISSLDTKERGTKSSHSGRSQDNGADGR
jgi:hypothetical protein